MNPYLPLYISLAGLILCVLAMVVGIVIVTRREDRR